MSPTEKKVFADAMKLPVDLQAQLAEKLICNVESNIDPNLEKLHLAEIARRLEDYHSGRVQSVDGNSVLRRVRKVLDR